MWTELKKRLAAELAATIEERFGVGTSRCWRCRRAGSWETSPRRPACSSPGCSSGTRGPSPKRSPEPSRRPAAVRDVQVQGAGFLNFFLDRRTFAAALLDAPLIDGPSRGGKVVIEHTNINPNKAAHIGHLRNAVLGDVLGRSLKSLGYPVEIQNYIDDTGRAARGRGGRLPRPARDVRRRGGGHPRAVRLLLLGPLQRGRPLVRGGPRTPAPAPRDPPRVGDRQGAARRDGPAGGAADRLPPPRDHEPARRLLRPAHPRERHPGAQLLRDGLRPPEGDRAPCASRRTARTPAAG